MLTKKNINIFTKKNTNIIIKFQKTMLSKIYIHPLRDIEQTNTITNKRTYMHIISKMDYGR